MNLARVRDHRNVTKGTEFPEALRDRARIDGVVATALLMKQASRYHARCGHHGDPMKTPLTRALAAALLLLAAAAARKTDIRVSARAGQASRADASHRRAAHRTAREDSTHRVHRQGKPFVRQLLRNLPRRRRDDDGHHLDGRRNPARPYAGSYAARPRPRVGRHAPGDGRWADGPVRSGDERQRQRRYAQRVAAPGLRHSELLELRGAFRARRSHVLVAGGTELSESSLHRGGAVGWRLHQP